MESREQLVEGRAAWFQRACWLAIAVYVVLAVPALFFPHGLGELFGHPPSGSAIWMRGFGMLLVASCVFHAFGMADPVRKRGVAWGVVTTHSVATWTWLILWLALDDGGALFWLFLVELVLMLLLGWTLARVASAETRSVNTGSDGPGLVAQAAGIKFGR